MTGPFAPQPDAHPPAARRRLWPIVVAVTVVLVVALVAGGVYVVRVFTERASADRWAGAGTPVGNPFEPSPSASTSRVVTGTSGVGAALSERVIGAGGVVRPVSVDYGITTVMPAFTCRITYLGEVVSYQVTTTPAGSDTWEWEAQPDRMVAVRKGIEAALWRRYAAQATAIRCDATLPEQQRVPAGTTLTDRCYFQPYGKDVAFGDSSSNRSRTVQVSITITDGAIVLREQTQ